MSGNFVESLEGKVKRKQKELVIKIDEKITSVTLSSLELISHFETKKQMPLSLTSLTTICLEYLYDYELSTTF